MVICIDCREKTKHKGGSAVDSKKFTIHMNNSRLNSNKMATCSQERSLAPLSQCYCCQRTLSFLMEFLNIDSNRCHNCDRHVCTSCIKNNSGVCRKCYIRRNLNLSPNQLGQLSNNVINKIIYSMDIDIQVSNTTNKEMCLYVIQVFLSTLKQSSKTISKTTQEMHLDSTKSILVEEQIVSRELESPDKNGENGTALAIKNATQHNQSDEEFSVSIPKVTDLKRRFEITNGTSNTIEKSKIEIKLTSRGEIEILDHESSKASNQVNSPRIKAETSVTTIGEKTRDEYFTKWRQISKEGVIGKNVDDVSDHAITPKSESNFKTEFEMKIGDSKSNTALLKQKFEEHNVEDSKSRAEKMVRWISSEQEIDWENIVSKNFSPTTPQKEKDFQYDDRAFSDAILKWSSSSLNREDAAKVTDDMPETVTVSIEDFEGSIIENESYTIKKIHDEEESARNPETVDAISPEEEIVPEHVIRNDAYNDSSVDSIVKITGGVEDVYNSEEPRKEEQLHETFNDANKSDDMMTSKVPYEELNVSIQTDTSIGTSEEDASLEAQSFTLPTTPTDNQQETSNDSTLLQTMVTVTVVTNDNSSQVIEEIQHGGEESEEKQLSLESADNHNNQAACKMNANDISTGENHSDVEKHAGEIVANTDIANETLPETQFSNDQTDNDRDEMETKQSNQDTEINVINDASNESTLLQTIVTVTTIVEEIQHGAQAGEEKQLSLEPAGDQSNQEMHAEEIFASTNTAPETFLNLETQFSNDQTDDNRDLVETKQSNLETEINVINDILINEKSIEIVGKNIVETTSADIVETTSADILEDHQKNEYHSEVKPSPEILDEHQKNDHVGEEKPSAEILEEHQKNDHVGEEKPSAEIIDEHKKNDHVGEEKPLAEILDEHKKNDHDSEEKPSVEILEGQKNDHDSDEKPSAEISEEHQKSDHDSEEKASAEILEEHQKNDHVGEEKPSAEIIDEHKKNDHVGEEKPLAEILDEHKKNDHDSEEKPSVEILEGQKNDHDSDEKPSAEISEEHQKSDHESEEKLSVEILEGQKNDHDSDEKPSAEIPEEHQKSDHDNDEKPSEADSVTENLVIPSLINPEAVNDMIDRQNSKEQNSEKDEIHEIGMPESHVSTSTDHNTEDMHHDIKEINSSDISRHIEQIGELSDTANKTDIKSEVEGDSRVVGNVVDGEEILNDYQKELINEDTTRDHNIQNEILLNELADQSLSTSNITEHVKDEYGEIIVNEEEKSKELSEEVIKTPTTISSSTQDIDDGHQSNDISKEIHISNNDENILLDITVGTNQNNCDFDVKSPTPENFLDDSEMGVPFNISEQVQPLAGEASNEFEENATNHKSDATVAVGMLLDFTSEDLQSFQPDAATSTTDYKPPDVNSLEFLLGNLSKNAQNNHSWATQYSSSENTSVTRVTTREVFSESRNNNMIGTVTEQSTVKEIPQTVLNTNNMGQSDDILMHQSSLEKHPLSTNNKPQITTAVNINSSSSDSSSEDETDERSQEEILKHLEKPKNVQNPEMPVLLKKLPDIIVTEVLSDISKEDPVMNEIHAEVLAKNNNQTLSNIIGQNVSNIIDHTVSNIIDKKFENETQLSTDQEQLKAPEDETSRVVNNSDSNDSSTDDDEFVSASDGEDDEIQTAIKKERSTNAHLSAPISVPEEDLLRFPRHSEVSRKGYLKNQEASQHISIESQSSERKENNQEKVISNYTSRGQMLKIAEENEIRDGQAEMSTMFSQRTFTSSTTTSNVTYMKKQTLIQTSKNIAASQSEMGEQDVIWEDIKVSGAYGNDGAICQICNTACVDCTLMNCGHQATCLDCGSDISKCPVCGQPITNVCT